MTAIRAGTEPMALRRVLVLAIAALAVGNGFARFSYAFVLPAMVDDVLGSYAVAGWLGAANLGGYLVGIVLVSFFSGRLAPIQILRLGLVGAVAGMAVLALAPTTPLLLLGMVVAGLGSSGVWVPLTAMVASSADASKRGTAMGALVAGVGVGLIVAGRIGALVRDVDGQGWRYVWGIQAAIGVIVLVVALLWRPPASADDAAATRGSGHRCCARSPAGGCSR